VTVAVLGLVLDQVDDVDEEDLQANSKIQGLCSFLVEVWLLIGKKDTLWL